MVIKKVLFLLLFLWLSQFSSAQIKISEHLLINNGLSNNYITDIAQDEKGRIWVGTESGLYSYDGFRFQSYNTSNSGLNSNMINMLWYNRQNGELWIGTKGDGICVMNISTNTITTIGENSQHANNIMHIAGLEKGDIWLISQTSIMCWKRDSLYEVYSDTKQGFFRCVCNIGDGILLLGHYMGGVSQFDTQTGTMKRLSLPNSQINNETVNDFVKDYLGRIWLATDSGLWYYSPETGKMEIFEPLKIANVTDIELIDGGEIWVSSHSGMWMVDLSKWSANRIPNLREHGSPTHNVRKIFQDSFGNVWLGSMGNGIDFISHEIPQFSKLCNQSIWGIYRDESGVWAGTTDRLLCFRDNMLVREIPLYRKGWEDSFALSINSDDQGNLMVCYFGHLLQIEKKSGTVKEILLDDGHSIFSLTFYKDRDGTLWITARDGIYTMRHGKVTREEKLNSVLARQSVHGIRRDHQGKLWVATYENGIYLFDAKKRLLQHLDKKNGLLSNSIQHLHMDPNDGIWLSTPDGMGYIPDTSKPEQNEVYGYQQGLNDSYIRAIQEDAKGNVWVSTNNGISLLRKKDQTFVNFNLHDGIPTNNFTGGAVEYNGKMYFTSLDGLCYFDPDALTNNRQMSSLQLFSITRPDKNTVHIIFGLSDYAQSRQAEYQYMVEGKNADWTSLDENAITFRNLSPGHYTIVIRARLKGGQWSNDNEIKASVYIQPPFWQSWWAYLIYIICLAGIGWSYFGRYKHHLKLQSDLELERQKNLDEQERNAERLQFFTNITHELRTPLTLILGPLEELKDDKTLPIKIKERLSMIHRSSEQLKNLITQLLEFRKTETHNQQLIVMRQDLRQTIEKVGQNFSELNTNTKLHYIINVGDTPQELYYDENVLMTILNNLMSNAAKYTPQGEIELSLTSDEQYAVITIRDTGYGIAPEALPYIFDRYYQAKSAHQASGTGIGLALVKSLCTLHEANIHVDSKEGRGTVITVTLKKGNSYPKALHKEGANKERTDEAIDESSSFETVNSRPIVLVVEDNNEIRHYIADSLADDYQVIKASDGQKGCEKAFEHIPDLIITDIMMPVMDGTELCRRIKQDIRTSHIPIIMLTAKDTQADQQEGYEVGADSYLTKPFSIPMLRSRIANLLAARKRLAVYLGTTDTHKQESETDTLSQLDRQFIDDITTFIEKNITDQNITMAMLGECVHMSHSTLYRKIKALTGLSGNEFIRKVRLRYSLQLMIKQHRNVSEAAYESGFSSLPYYRSCFKEEFGMTPTEYLKKV
jgi:signal transduction histidine kinase/ligand-binding sensor domain-containing protein/DNA-binding response OmpR family regulator